MRFHSFIYEMSGNPFIATTVEAHWNYLRRVMVAVLLHAARGEIVWRQHHEILARSDARYTPLLRAMLDMQSPPEISVPADGKHEAAELDVSRRRARERKRQEVEGARLVPTGSSYEDFVMRQEGGVSSGLKALGSTAGSLLGRRGSVRSGRRSGDGSMLGR